MTRANGVEDLFSRDPAGYARFRPRYPRELFAYLATLTPARQRAWDCATGNGQAAVGLADWFEEVIATDASAEQIACAERRENVRYMQAPAHRLDVPSECIDLVTVAQALHWFHLPSFYDEVRRVTTPGGVFAAWCYHHVIIDERVDRVIRRLMLETVGPYWPQGRALVEERYATISFPFEEIETPTFTIDTAWSLEDLLGYISTWSAVHRYREATGSDPVGAVQADLTEAWGRTSERRAVSWPIYLRVGLVAS